MESFRERLLPALPVQFADFDTSTVRELAAAAWHRRERTAIAPFLDCQLYPALAPGSCYLRMVYDPCSIAVLRRWPALWRKTPDVWEIGTTPAAIVAALAEVAVDAEFVYQHPWPVGLDKLVGAESEVEGLAIGGTPPEGNGGTDSRYLALALPPATTLPVDPATLSSAVARFGLSGRYAYQRDGVLHLLLNSSALLADDMGLGKSRQACVAAHLAAGDRQVLIVCPASLRINWQREISAVLPDAAIAIVGSTPKDELARHRWLIASYEQLGVIVQHTELPIEVMVIDECHYLKEHGVNRTLHAFLLAQRIPRRMLLSGTPVLNRETELHSLLKLSGHPLGDQPLAEFRSSYAGGAAARAALKVQLDRWMLRRSKAVLDLPGKERQVRWLQLGDRANEYASVCRQELPSLAKVTRLRQLLEDVKVDFVLDTVRSLGAGDKLLVFCEYLASVERLLAALAQESIGAVRLIGSDTMRGRQRAVDAFQTDPEVRVFVATTPAAGVGLTLTAANLVLFASLPWTPAAQRQAEDRANRNGQTRKVTVLIPLVTRTIDVQIHALLAVKEGLEEQLIQAESPEAAAQRMADQLIGRLPQPTRRHAADSGTFVSAG